MKLKKIYIFNFNLIFIIFQCVKTNMSNRVTDGSQPDVFDSRMLSVFFHHVRQYGLYPVRNNKLKQQK